MEKNHEVFTTDRVYTPAEIIYNNDIETDFDPDYIEKVKAVPLQTAPAKELNEEEDPEDGDMDAPVREWYGKAGEMVPVDEDNSYYNISGDNHLEIEEDMDDFE